MASRLTSDSRDVDKTDVGLGESPCATPERHDNDPKHISSIINDTPHSRTLPPLPESPNSRRKVLAERGAALLLSAATLDEDDDENAALYTEVVLSDEEDENNYAEETFTPNRDRTFSGSALSPRISRNLPKSPLSNRALRATISDDFDNDNDDNAMLNTSTGYLEEEDFRIRHLLNYGDGSTPSAPPAPPPATPAQEAQIENKETPVQESHVVRAETDVSTPPSSSKKGSRNDAALFVDDKPWRNNRGTTLNAGSKSADKRSLLDRFRKRVGGTNRQKSESATVEIPIDDDNIMAAMDDLLASSGGQGENHRNEHLGTMKLPSPEQDQSSRDLILADQDMVVEAASRPSSDESSFGENSTQDEWDLDYDDDDGKDEGFAWEKPVDWKTLAEYQLPTHYARTSTGFQPRRQGSLSSNDLTTMASSNAGANFSQRRASHFIWQHGMILHAVFQLLVERDHLGVEASMDKSDNILKKGPLKKLSNAGRARGPSKLKVKYVEIRRGNMCYYEDSGQESGRKIIHLRSTDTVVDIAKTKPNGKQNSSAPYSFEITQTGSPKTVWAANSDTDRQAWIRAINAAMIGGDDDLVGINSPEKNGEQLLVSSHHSSIEKFESLRSKLCGIDVLDDYVASVQGAVDRGGSIQIPVSWIRQQVKDLGKSGPSDGFNPAFASGDPEKQIRASVAEFWERISLTQFALNGLAIPSSLPFSPERIFGSLTRCIMQYDHAFIQEREVDLDPNAVISELQAASYARDILVTVLRMKDQQDVLYAVNDLLRNDDLVILSAKEEHEMVHLEVSFAGEDWNDHDADPEHSGNEKTIWLHSKKKNSATSRWTHRFTVLSGNQLSYYESATPRPHGLRRQLVLRKDCEVKRVQVETESHVLLLSTSEEERYLLFETEDEMMDWNVAIQKAIDSSDEQVSERNNTKQKHRKVASEGGDSKQKNEGSSDSINADSSLTKQRLRIPGSLVKNAKGGSESVFKTAKDGGMKLFGGRFRHRRRGSSEAPDEGQGVPIPRRPSVSVLIDTTPQIGKRDPTVQCVAQHLHRFVVGDRFGNESATGGSLFEVHAKLFQAFMLSGGPNGKISRGKPLVEIDIRDSNLLEEDEKFDKLMMFI